MITKSKKFRAIPVMVCLLAIILVSSSVHATETLNETNIGVSFTPPSTDLDSDIMPLSVTTPSSVWDVSSNGQYDFSGWSYSDTLYTNYKFKGKTSYTIYIKNTGSNTITVKAKTTLKTYGSTTIAAGKSATINLSGIDKDTKFYISFGGSGKEYHFEGYIR